MPVFRNSEAAVNAYGGDSREVNYAVVDGRITIEARKELHLPGIPSVTIAGFDAAGQWYEYLEIPYGYAELKFACDPDQSWCQSSESRMCGVIECLRNGTMTRVDATSITEVRAALRALRAPRSGDEIPVPASELSDQSTVILHRSGATQHCPMQYACGDSMERAQRDKRFSRVLLLKYRGGTVALACYDRLGNAGDLTENGKRLTRPGILAKLLYRIHPTGELEAVHDVSDTSVLSWLRIPL